MNIVDLIKKLNTIKKGTYHTVVFKSENGDYKKVTKMVVRFVNYANIKGVIVKESKPKDYILNIIPSILKFNENTQNYLVYLYTTNHHKPHCDYYYKDKPISEEEYYKYNKPSNGSITKVFTVKASNILEL